MKKFTKTNRSNCTPGSSILSEFISIHKFHNLLITTYIIVRKQNIKLYERHSHCLINMHKIFLKTYLYSLFDHFLQASTVL